MDITLKIPVAEGDPSLAMGGPSGQVPRGAGELGVIS